MGGDNRLCWVYFQVYPKADQESIVAEGRVRTSGWDSGDISSTVASRLYDAWPDSHFMAYIHQIVWDDEVESHPSIMALAPEFD